MTIDGDTARKVERVKKLLKLARHGASNEHEAATALRLAQELMAEEGITDSDVAASDATEASTETGAEVRVPAWESDLAVAIGRVFGCDPIHHSGRGNWSFVGVAPLPELAVYAFDVLRRQCLSDRKSYITSKLKRVTVRANKIKRADLFCQGWIETATVKARSFRRPAEHTNAIEAYKVQRYGKLDGLDPLDRNDGRTLRDYEVRDLMSGRAAGDDADLRVGVSGVNSPAAALLRNL
jgi:hypothetical protein